MSPGPLQQRAAGAEKILIMVRLDARYYKEFLLQWGLSATAKFPKKLLYSTNQLKRAGGEM